MVLIFFILLRQSNNMELGISTFGELQPDGTAGKAINAQKRVQELLEEVKLADDVPQYQIPCAIGNGCDIA